MSRYMFGILMLCLCLGLGSTALASETDFQGQGSPEYPVLTAPGFGSGGAALAFEWTVLTNMPQPVYYHAVVSAQASGLDKLFSVGGYVTAETDSCWSYDISTDTWEGKASMPAAKGHVAAAVVGNKVYVPGGSSTGYTAVSSNYEYDPDLDSWATVSSMPTAVCFHGAVAWRDTLIYCIGGQNSGTYYNTVQVYDPAADAWSSATSMPITNRSMAVGIVGDTILVTGGFNGAYVSTTYIGVIDGANPMTIMWTTGADVPMGSSGLAGRSRVPGATLRGRFYICGGDDHGSANPAFDAWEYDPVADSWTQLPNRSVAISNAQNFVGVGGRASIYAAGGYNVQLAAGSDVLECLAGLIHDVGMVSIDDPGPLVAPGQPVVPSITIENFTDSTETFWTFFLVDSMGSNVYMDSSLVSGFMGNTTTTVFFTDWYPDGHGNTYDLTAYTGLAIDEMAVNDTLRSSTIAYTVDSLITCGWAYPAPTIDGTIDSSEWAGAAVVDISDILGMGSAGVSPNSVVLFAMNDSTHVFFALDYLIDDTETINDRTTVYLDEDNDDAWAPDSSEGVYWAYRHSTGPRLMYNPKPTGPFLFPIPGAEFALGFTDHVAFEFSVPLGTQIYEVDAQPGDTMGVHICARDQGAGEDEGWWLQTLSPAHLESVAYYGHIVLHEVVVGVEERLRVVRPSQAFGLIGASPSPFCGDARISYATEERGRVRVEVFDAAGRAVRELFDGVAEPGMHEVKWDGRDAAGRNLPSGVYFYSLSSGKRASSMKTVLLR